jgi:hypothetical protein
MVKEESESSKSAQEDCAIAEARKRLDEMRLYIKAGHDTGAVTRRHLEPPVLEQQGRTLDADAPYHSTERSENANLAVDFTKTS